MSRIAIIGILILLILGIGGYILSRNMQSSNVLGANAQNSNTQNGSTMGTVAQGNATVQVTNTGFQPANITIKAGTMVTWINSSGADISINSNDHPTHLLYPPLNLGMVSDGDQVSLVFNTPGTYGYHNHLNPSQKGTVTVQ